MNAEVTKGDGEMKFPRQPNSQGGWTIAPNFLEQVRRAMPQAYPNEQLPDYEPSWEQIEMVLLAAERMNVE